MEQAGSELPEVLLFGKTKKNKSEALCSLMKV